MSKNLQPGETLPDFELPDDSGVTRRLSELKAMSIPVNWLKPPWTGFPLSSNSGEPPTGCPGARNRGLTHVIVPPDQLS